MFFGGVEQALGEHRGPLGAEHRDRGDVDAIEAHPVERLERALVQRARGLLDRVGAWLGVFDDLEIPRGAGGRAARAAEIPPNDGRVEGSGSKDEARERLDRHRVRRDEAHAFAEHPRLDGSNGTGYNVYIPMGLTAENVADRCKVSREAQDEWAALSQQRAVAARESGHFDSEIVGVDIPETHDAGGDVIPAHTVTRDDGPRAGTTMETLSKLKPAFKPRGSVTAGNSCPLNDGAAALLVMSEEKASERGVKPRARIVASAVAAIRPEIMGLGPIPACRAVLKQAGLKIDDIDLVELNEAFAAQVLPCRDELGIDPEKLNINGGAIALGHPFGMTGARIMTTLLNNLDSVDGRYGIEAMCVAGGMGQAMIVERLNGSN